LTLGLVKIISILGRHEINKSNRDQRLLQKKTNDNKKDFK